MLLGKLPLVTRAGSPANAAVPLHAAGRRHRRRRRRRRPTSEASSRSPATTEPTPHWLLSSTAKSTSQQQHTRRAVRGKASLHRTRVLLAPRPCGDYAVRPRRPPLLVPPPALTPAPHASCKLRRITDKDGTLHALAHWQEAPPAQLAEEALVPFTPARGGAARRRRNGGLLVSIVGRLLACCPLPSTGAAAASAPPWAEPARHSRWYHPPALPTDCTAVPADGATAAAARVALCTGAARGAAVAWHDADGEGALRLHGPEEEAWFAALCCAGPCRAGCELVRGECCVPTGV